MDIFPALLWLIILLTIGMVKKGAHTNEPHYRYFMPNLFIKLAFSLGFALVYIFLYGGGDTIAYFESAVSLNNLFLKDPVLYFHQLFFDYKNGFHVSYFDANTGYPPGWIFREQEGFFVAKIMSVFSFFTLKSYLAITFIMAYLTANAAWKLFEFIRSFNLNNEKWLAFGLLFLPSVNFWCSGVSKDTVVFISSIHLIVHAFHLISTEKKGKFKNVFFFVFYAFLIYHIRSFIVIAIMLPLSFAWITRMAKRMGAKSGIVLLLRSVLVIGGIVVVVTSMSSQQSEDQFLQSNTYLQEAAVVQNDFQNNDIYGDKRYSLGEVSFTPIGLLKIAPFAILTGIYKPFIWEALSPTLLFNGIESILFLYFTFLFLKENRGKKIAFIRKHEILVFSIIFVLIISFMTGLTSVLFGVLVRLRAPLLPFLFILLTLDINKSSFLSLNPDVKKQE